MVGWIEREREREEGRRDDVVLCHGGTGLAENNEKKEEKKKTKKKVEHIGPLKAIIIIITLFFIETWGYAAATSVL